MWQTIRNAWKIQELRNKILFTLMMLLVYSLGGIVPTPFVNVGEVAKAFNLLEIKFLGHILVAGDKFINIT